jgi:O-antigen ligase
MKRDLALLATSFVLLTNPIAHVVRAVNEVPYRSWHPINVLVVASLLFLATAWLIKRPPLLPVASTWPMLTIAGFAAVTAPWSVSPLRSVAWAMHLGGMTLVANAVAHTFSPALIRRAALMAIGVLLLLSFVMITLTPSYGTSDESLYRGAWRGVFAGKNHLGLVAALGVVLSLISQVRWRFVVLAGSLMTLVQTRSGGGMLMVASGVAMLLVIRALTLMPQHWRRPFCITLGTSSLLLAAAAFLFWPTIAKSIGRDVSLSGRTVLWKHVIDRISERPLIGYGLRAYFEGDRDHRALQAAMNEATARGRTFSPPRTEVIPQANVIGSPSVSSPAPAKPPPTQQVRLLPEPKWRIHNAHNGLLALALDLGIPVTLLFLCFVAWRCAPAAILAVRGMARPDDTAALVLVAAFFAHNLVEVSVLRSWHPEALLFLLVLMSLCAPHASNEP